MLGPLDNRSIRPAAIPAYPTPDTDRDTEIKAHICWHFEHLVADTLHDCDRDETYYRSVTVNCIGAFLGGLYLTRAQCIAAFGAHEVADAEEEHERDMTE